MMSVLSQNGAWWASFRHKTSAIIYQSPIVELAEFAARTYTSSNPAELGMLVTAYARSAGDADHLYELVDTLVISEFAFLATTEGQECLVLLAKSYIDIGQPRRAWLMWRRGMDIAQLMVWKPRICSSLLLTNNRKGSLQVGFSCAAKDMVGYLSRRSLR